MISDAVYASFRSMPFLQRQLRRVVRRLPHRMRQTEHLGQKLWIDPSELAGFYLYYECEYDDYIFEFLKSRMRRYDLAVDVGAHYGIYTVYFGAHAKRVIAFEPEPAIAFQLKRNVELNHLSNVTINESCVGKTSGMVQFLAASKANEGLGRIAPGNSQAQSRPCTTLDEVLGPSLQNSCLIKMDIEGGEWLALQGAQQVVKSSRFPLAILLEVHPGDIERVGGTVEALEKLLKDMGLKISALTPQGLMPLAAGNDFRFWWAENSR